MSLISLRFRFHFLLALAWLALAGCGVQKSTGDAIGNGQSPDGAVSGNGEPIDADPPGLRARCTASPLGVGDLTLEIELVASPRRRLATLTKVLAGTTTTLLTRLEVTESRTAAAMSFQATGFSAIVDLSSATGATGLSAQFIATIGTAPLSYAMTCTVAR